jgi:hypothetical protein
MESLYGKLISDIVSLFETQYELAMSHGHPPSHFVLCGGPTRNDWFRERVFDMVRLKHPALTCGKVTE